MIETLHQLREYLSIEKALYKSGGVLNDLYLFLCNDRQRAIWKYQKNYRIEEYFYNKKKYSWLYLVPYIIMKHRKMRLGRKLGIDMGENVFKKGLFMAHTGSIIVGSAQVGENCVLHGDNTIGSGAVIGDNCELWVGARVFDGALLQDHTTVATGAIVLTTFYEKGITVAGIPAKRIK